MNKISGPEAAFRYFRGRLRKDVEEFWVAALTAEKHVAASACLFRGTVDHCLFHPRDVFRFACQKNASSFLVAHNHPSGNVEPSTEDISITEQLATIAVILEVPMVDHLILAGDKYYSFLEAGRLSAVDKLLHGPGSVKAPGGPYGR